MIASIALPLSLLISALLWHSDVRTHPRISWGLWIVIAWVARVSSRSVVYWLNPELLRRGVETDYAAGTPLERYFLTGLMLLAVLVLVNRRVLWSRFLKMHWALALLFAFMLLSTLWSGFPVISLKRWFRSIGDVLMVMVVMTEEDYREAFLSVFRRCAYLLIPLSIVFIRYVREIGVQYTWDGALEMWIGVSEGKNGLGQLACVSGIVMLSDLSDASPSRPPRVVSVGLLAGCLYLLNGSPTSRSSTALGAFLAAALLFLVIGRLRSAGRPVVAVAALGGVVALLLLYLGPVVAGRSPMEYIAGLFGREASLTGRVPLWSHLINLNRSSRWLGHGFGGFWLGDLSYDLSEFFIWQPASGHNGFLDVYLDLGLVGLAIVLAVLVEGYRSVGRELPGDFALFRVRLSLLAAVVLVNLTESALVRPTTFIWVVFLFAVANPAAAPRPATTGSPVFPETRVTSATRGGVL